MIDPQRKPHHHAALIKAWADGAEIEFLTSNGWVPCPSPLWIAIYQYRVKPTPHKWQKEMDAAREGKTIQWRFSKKHMAWRNWHSAKKAFRAWDVPSYEFRIAPEQVNILYEVVDGHLEKCAPLAKAHLCCTFEEGKLIAAKVLS